MLFDWVDYWAALIPFHSQMLADNQVMNEQGDVDYPECTKPEGSTGIGDNDYCE
jgi:hypothetical protein